MSRLTTPMVCMHEIGEVVDRIDAWCGSCLACNRAGAQELTSARLRGLY